MRFEIGDVVTVREWDDMMAEWPKDSTDEGIMCDDLCFVRDMKDYCGLTAPISRFAIFKWSSKRNQEFYLEGIDPAFRFNQYMVIKGGQLPDVDGNAWLSVLSAVD